MWKNMHSKLDIIKVPFKFAPKYAGIIGIQKILEGIVPIFQVLTTANFLDTAISILNKEKSFNQIIIPLILVGSIILYTWISQQLIRFMEVKLEMELRESLRLKITEKRAKLMYRYIEDNNTWNLISRIAKEPEVRCKNAYVDFMSMIAMYIRAIGLMVVLITYVWWGAVAMLIISVALFKVAVKNGEDFYEADREVSKYVRKFEYLEEVLTGRESAAERTLFGYTNDINEKWNQQFECARRIIYKIRLKAFKRSALRGTLAIISA